MMIEIILEIFLLKKNQLLTRIKIMNKANKQKNSLIINKEVIKGNLNQRLNIQIKMSNLMINLKKTKINMSVDKKM